MSVQSVPEPRVLRTAMSDGGKITTPIPRGRATGHRAALSLAVERHRASVRRAMIRAATA